MSEKRDDYGIPYEDRGPIMLGIVMLGMVGAFMGCIVTYLVMR